MRVVIDFRTSKVSPENIVDANDQDYDYVTVHMDQVAMLIMTAEQGKALWSVLDEKFGITLEDKS